MAGLVELRPRSHPRACSVSSSTSLSSSSSASSGPSVRRNHGWRLHEQQKPGWRDTTAPSKKPSRQTTPLRQRNAPRDRAATPESPPSSPLPLSFCRPGIGNGNETDTDDQRQPRGVKEGQCRAAKAGEQTHPRESTLRKPDGTPTASSPKRQTNRTSSNMNSRTSPDNCTRPPFILSTSVHSRPNTRATRSSLDTATLTGEGSRRHIARHSDTKSKHKLATEPSACANREGESQRMFRPSTTGTKSSPRQGTTHTQAKTTRGSTARSETAVITAMTTARNDALTTTTVNPLYSSERKKRANVVVKTPTVTCGKHARTITSSADENRTITRQQQIYVDGVDYDIQVALPTSGPPMLPGPSAQTPSTSPQLSPRTMITTQESTQGIDSDSTRMLKAGEQAGEQTAVHCPNGPQSLRSPDITTDKAGTTEVNPPTSFSSMSTFPSSLDMVALETTPPAEHMNKDSSNSCSFPTHSGKSYNTVVATELMASIPKEADANGLLTVPEPASKDMAVVATASVQDALHVEMLPTPTSSYGNIQVERNQQENYGHRAQKTNLLASLNLNLAARPLVTAKEPTVMFNLLTLLKEQRQSRNGVGCTDNDINDTNCKREARPACATPNHTENACRDLDNPNQNRYHPKDSDNEYINNIEKNNHNDNSNENYRQPTAPATSNRVGISFQDKKQFLEIQEMRRNNARQRSQSATGLTTIHKGDGSPPSAFPLLRSTLTHLQPLQQQQSSRSTLSDFPASFFDMRDRRPPTFSSRTLATLGSLAPARPPIPTMKRRVTDPQSSSLSSLSLSSSSSSSLSSSSSSSLSSSLSTSSLSSLLSSSSSSSSAPLPKMPTPDVSLTTSCVPCPLPERHPARHQIRSTAPSSPAPYSPSSFALLTREPPKARRVSASSSSTVTSSMSSTTAWSSSSAQERSVAPPYLSTMQSWQHDSGGDIEKPSIQHSSPAAVRRAGNKSVNLSGESEEEDLCYFTIPVRTRSRSPSPSPYPIQDRLPSISERQEQAQEKSNGAGDFSVLNSRFANLKLMDSLCPIQPCPLQAGQGQEHGNARMMDPMWAVQITQLLNYLADKADIEEEEQGSSFGQAPFARPCLRVGAAGIRTSQSIETDIGLYKQILHDWVLRLDQVPRAVYEGHSGLKREIDKIRWQHNIVSSSPSTLTTTVAGKGSLKL